jgi:hypothetical protein
MATPADAEDVEDRSRLVADQIPIVRVEGDVDLDNLVRVEQLIGFVDPGVRGLRLLRGLASQPGEQRARCQREAPHK